MCVGALQVETDATKDARLFLVVHLQTSAIGEGEFDGACDDAMGVRLLAHIIDNVSKDGGTRDTQGVAASVTYHFTKHSCQTFLQASKILFLDDDTI